MIDDKIYKRLEQVFLEYRISKENQKVINDYLQDKIMENELIQIVPEHPGEDTYEKKYLLSRLFDEVYGKELERNKIIRILYYLYRKHIGYLVVLQKQICTFDMKNVSKVLRKLEEYSLPPEYYIASYVLNFINRPNGLYHHEITSDDITIEYLTVLQEVYDIDKSIIWKTRKYTDYIGKQYVNLCLFLNDEISKEELIQDIVKLFLMLYREEDRKQLIKYLESPKKYEIKDITATISNDFHHDISYRALLITICCTYNDIEESSSILKFLIEKNAAKCLKGVEMCLQKDRVHTDEFIKNLINKLKLSNDYLIEFIISRYSETLMPKSIDDYNSLFKLKEIDILKVINRFQGLDRCMFYSILDKNEGREYTQQYNNELMAFMGKEMTENDDSLYYYELEEYVRGEKTLSQISPLTKINDKYYYSFFNYNFLALLINNDGLISRRVLSYLLYGRSIFYLNRMIQLYDYNKSMEVIKSLPISEYELLKIAIGFKETVYTGYIGRTYIVNKVIDKRKGLKVDLRMLIQDNIANIKDRAFNKGEFKVEEMLFILELVSDLYKSTKVSKKDYKHILLQSGNHTSTYIKDDTLRRLKELKDENVILSFLNSKKVSTRTIGVLATEENMTPLLITKLNTMVKEDKSSKVIATINKLISSEQDISETKIKTIFDEVLHKRIKNKFSWINLEDMPKLLSKTGVDLDDHYKYIIIDKYDKLENYENKIKEDIRDEVDVDSLCTFTYNLLDRWVKNDALIKDKWVLSLVGDFGGHDSLVLLNSCIKEWAKHNRVKMACYGLKTMTPLALRGHHEALVAIDYESRKSRYRKLKSTAGEEMAYIVKKLGITIQELEDRLISNLGFDENGRKYLDYGSRKITLELDNNGNIKIMKEHGTIVKNLPKPNKRDDSDLVQRAKVEYKMVKKQLKSMVKLQSEILNDSLCYIRVRTYSDWKKTFIDNMIMQKFAISLIWGIYKDNELQQSFRYIDDGSYVDIYEEDIHIKQGTYIALVHPIEMKEDELEAWKQQLADYEITQPIAQIYRKAFIQNSNDKGKILRFKGIKMDSITMISRTKKYGWFKGTVEDGGCFYYFYKNFGGTSVKLNITGLQVNGEFEDSTVIKEITVEGGVSDRLFSEILYELTNITSNCQGKVKNQRP